MEEKVINLGALEAYDALKPQLKPVAITYENLVALRNAGGLMPFCHYRITDYVTTTNNTPAADSGVCEYRSLEHPFDLLVTADSPSSIEADAQCVYHEGEPYFADKQYYLDSVKVKYTLDNDTHYEWADPNGKGVIYEMTDMYDNIVGFDWLNIQFRRGVIKPSSMLKIPASGTDYIKSRLETYYSDVSDKNITEGIPKWIHCFHGYLSEPQAKAFSSQYRDKNGNIEQLSPTGNRMFVKVYKDKTVLLEVDHWEWFFFVNYISAVGVEAINGLFADGARVHNNTVIDYQNISDSVYQLPKSVITEATFFNNKLEIFRNSTFLRASLTEATNISQTLIKGLVQIFKVTGNLSNTVINGLVNESEMFGEINTVFVGDNFRKVLVKPYISKTVFDSYVHHATIGNIENSAFTGYLYYVEFAETASCENSYFAKDVDTTSFKCQVVNCTIHSKIYACEFKGELRSVEIYSNNANQWVYFMETEGYHENIGVVPVQEADYKQTLVHTQDNRSIWWTAPNSVDNAVYPIIRRAESTDDEYFEDMWTEPTAPANPLYSFVNVGFGLATYSFYGSNLQAATVTCTSQYVTITKDNKHFSVVADLDSMSQFEISVNGHLVATVDVQL